MTKAIFIILALAGFASGAEMEIADRLSVDGGSIFKSTVIVTGNVGIGTDTPNSRLEVKGNLVADGMFKGTHTVLDDSMLDNFTLQFGGDGRVRVADRLEQNILSNAFEAAVAGRLTKFGMVDGIMDEFEDQSGVDATASTNYEYDAAGHTYSPLKTSVKEADYMEYTTTASAQAAYASSLAYGNTSGEVTIDGLYTVHKFTVGGTFVAGKAGNVTYLVVAGGGGGGSWEGGGGGGGMRTGTLALTAGGKTVIVGQGGIGAASGSDATNGGNSQFDTIVANGGGGVRSDGKGMDGGSGGGGSFNNSGGAGNTPSTTPPQGHNGGAGSATIPYEAGGGGAGAAGGNGGGTAAGNGGDGAVSDILAAGNFVAYGGGGGGSGGYNAGGTWNPGAGGAGGGGAGSQTTTGTPGTPNTGGGGGGGGRLTNTLFPGGNGGSGIVIVKCKTSDFLVLQSYSESFFITQGTNSLKGVAAAGSINQTLTKTVSPALDLSNYNTLKFDIRASRTGGNIKIGLHDSGGTTTELTPNITSSDTWQTVFWDISQAENINKDAINSIIITIVNADAANTFYIDNFYGPGETYNMTLKSNATVAESTPAKARIVLFEEDVDTCTLNTDITASVSRDNGTTYSTATLSNEGDWSTGKRILSGVVDISTQPSGTNMKWKVDTLNNRDIKLHGVGLNWD